MGIPHRSGHAAIKAIQAAPEREAQPAGEFSGDEQSFAHRLELGFPEIKLETLSRIMAEVRPYLKRKSGDRAFLAGLAAGRPNDFARIFEALKNLTKYVQVQAAESNLEWALSAKNQVLVNALKAINSIEGGSANG